MKKNVIIFDKLCVGITIFNVAASLIGIVFSGMLYDESLLYSIVSANGLYLIFAMPVLILACIILNIIAFVKKLKTKNSVSINIIVLIACVLLIPIWCHFLSQALLGV